MLTAIVLVASIAAQLTAAALALRLIRVTGWRLAWSMIAVAMALMGVRRSITFYRLMTGDLSRPPELAAELLALAIALLMVAGVVLIASRFRAARRAEGALRESERQFRDFTDSASDWVWEMDADLRFTSLSEPMLKIAGVRLEDVLGKTRWELAGASVERDGNWRRHRADIEARKPFRDFQYTYRDGDGGAHHWKISGTPVFDDSGAFKGYRGVASDETAEVQARARAAEAEARLVEALDGISDGFALYDADDRLVLRNEKYIVGPEISSLAQPGTRFEIIFRAMVEAGYFPDAVGLEEKFIRERLDYHRDPRGVREQRTRDDHWVHVVERKTREGGTLTLITDITELKLRERELRESEERYRAILDNMVDTFYRTDQEGRIVMASRSATELLGYPVDELIGRSLGDLYVDPDSRRAYLQALQTNDGNVRGYEGALRRKDGREIWVSTNARYRFDADGTVIGVEGTTRDITERKQAEQALRESEARLQAILDHAPAIIHLKDREGRYLVVNKQFEKIYGFEAGDIIGKTVHDLFEPGISDAYIESDRVVLETRAPVERELPDPFVGGERTLLVVKFPVVDSAGEVVAVGGVETDITAIKRIEQQLIQAQKMEAVGQLTGGVAHDFNNLLAVILGNLELLDERLDGDASSRDLAQRAVQAAERGAALTQRLLAFSRKQTLQPEVTDLNKLVPGMTQLLRRALGETIEIETVLAAGLWHTLVDRGQLENALLNLALNARDAISGYGKLTIETANARLDEDYAAGEDEVAAGQYVMLAVSDTGDGMPSEVVARAFEPFFTTKETGKGSGLGLSTVYGFARQSGGHVKIYSEPGHGTLVKLYLPKATAAAAARAEPRDAPPDHLGSGETIMVVEDD
ncbi:MAG: PAS domain S-box protein, partial [Alphaproteobacteria bacterium]